MGYVKASLLFLVLWLVACSSVDSGDGVVARYDKDGTQYSPAFMRGIVYYLKGMKPEKIKIVSVDAKLNPIDSIEVSVAKDDDGRYAFGVGDRDYEYPFVKIVPVFPLGENAKMEFAQYVRLREFNIDIALNLPEAVMSGRVETLVREKELDFDSAMTQAIAEMRQAFNTFSDVMSYEMYVNEYIANEARLNGLLMYIYCRHEVSDSVFYSTFNEYRETFAQSGIADSALLVKSADAWLSTFKVFDDMDEHTQFRSLSRDSVFGVSRCDYSLFRRAYGAPLQLTTDIWETGSEFYSRIENKSSMYDGRTFVYEKRLGYWRLQTELDDSMGVCLYGNDLVSEYNDSYYRCRPGSASWNEETRRDSLLNKIFGNCARHYASNGVSGYLRDSLFVCECDTSRVCAWTDKYVNSTFKKGDDLYASALSARAVQRYGKCSDDLIGEVRQIDSVSVSCTWFYGWKLVENDEE